MGNKVSDDVATALRAVRGGELVNFLLLVGFGPLV